MKLLMKDFANRNQTIIFTNLKKSVVATFKGVNPKNFIYCESYEELHDHFRKYSVTTVSVDVEIKNEQCLTRL